MKGKDMWTISGVTRIIRKSHHKIDLVIVTSLSQTKDIKSLRLSIRRLRRKDWTEEKRLNSAQFLHQLSTIQHKHWLSRWRTRWSPSPTRQHQGLRRVGQTSCLWVNCFTILLLMSLSSTIFPCLWVRHPTFSIYKKGIHALYWPGSIKN